MREGSSYVHRSSTCILRRDQVVLQELHTLFLQPPYTSAAHYLMDASAECYCFMLASHRFFCFPLSARTGLCCFIRMKVYIDRGKNNRRDYDDGGLTGEYVLTLANTILRCNNLIYSSVLHKPFYYNLKHHQPSTQRTSTIKVHPIF